MRRDGSNNNLQPASTTSMSSTTSSSSCREKKKKAKHLGIVEEEKKSAEPQAAATSTSTSTSSALETGPSLTNNISASATAIQVAVRVRPFLPFEAGNSSCVHVLPNQTIRIDDGSQQHSHNSNANTFTFDATFGTQSTQSQVFRDCVRPLVNACLEGYNATVIAYGQTGSGKTHTILGQASPDALSAASIDHDAHVDDTSEAGVIPRALRALFHALQTLQQTQAQKSAGSKYEFLVKVQFLELYGEDIRDLLRESPSETKLSIRDGRKNIEPEVIGACYTKVANAEEALLCLTRGTLRRVTRATAMNSESSRSHAIMSVVVEQTLTAASGTATATAKDKDKDKGSSEVSTKKSKFHFVDLAGSERIKRTQASGQGVREGININKGLLVLGNVISALASSPSSSAGAANKTFVPYRDSKLTRLLKGSLGGNHKTLMIACVSPSSSNTEESINSLRYANRAKNIQNKAVVNQDAGSKLISELRGHLKLLAAELLRVRQLASHANLDVHSDQTAITDDLLRALLAGGSAAASAASALKAAATSNTKPGATATSSSPHINNHKSLSTSMPSNPQIEKALEEVERLKQSLKQSDDKVVEYQRQLEWIKEELRVSKEEVKELTGGEKSENGDDVSVMTEVDFGDAPRLSQETYQTVKSIYEEKIIQMNLQLKEREEERENIAMTLYRHESDSQRLRYVKDSLKEDLASKEAQLSISKQDLRDLNNLTVVPESSPNFQRKFRRRRFQQTKRMASNTSTSMSAYYFEKLAKIERHIKVREGECANLCVELEKLEADSQIFADLSSDLSDRLKKKKSCLEDMRGQRKLGAMSESQLTRLNDVIGQEERERDNLRAELERLQADAKTFDDLVKALTEERSTKQAHVEKYKRKHRELAKSIGSSSPYAMDGDSDGSGGGKADVDFDDDGSVMSAITFMSIDTINTDSNTVNTMSTAYTTGSITKKEFDYKKSQLEAAIFRQEEDRMFILKDLDKLESDTRAFNDLSNALKEKLRLKEEQIEKLKKEQEEFGGRLRMQQKELADLAEEIVHEEGEGEDQPEMETNEVDKRVDTEPETDNDSADPAYMNGQSENILVR